MTYERNLTFNLRIRGLSEPEISEVLDEVRAHQASAGTSAETEFGTAEEYAKQFPKLMPAAIVILAGVLAGFLID